MFSHIITRTVLGTVLAATLLAPAAAADNWWGRDRQSGLDQAIATALTSRAAATSAASLLDPAIKVAILNHKAATPTRPDYRAGTREFAGVTSTPIPLDPAIKVAILNHKAATPTRPDDRAGTHGSGSLAQPAPVTSTNDGLDWNNLGFGAGAALGALLLALGSVIGMRRTKIRATNA